MYTRVKNNYSSYQDVSEMQINTFIEEHYGTQIGYNGDAGTFMHLDFSWIKRNAANNFFEIKARISYAV
jgi:hypothetical protein